MTLGSQGSLCERKLGIPISSSGFVVRCFGEESDAFVAIYSSTKWANFNSTTDALVFNVSMYFGAHGYGSHCTEGRGVYDIFTYGSYRHCWKYGMQRKLSAKKHLFQQNPF